MKEIVTQITLITFVVGLVAFVGCGGVKDDPDIVDMMHHEAANEGEGENERAARCYWRYDQVQTQVEG